MPNDLCLQNLKSVINKNLDRFEAVKLFKVFYTGELLIKSDLELGLIFLLG